MEDFTQIYWVIDSYLAWRTLMSMNLLRTGKGKLVLEKHSVHWFTSGDQWLIFKDSVTHCWNVYILFSVGGLQFKWHIFLLCGVTLITHGNQSVLSVVCRRRNLADDGYIILVLESKSPWTSTWQLPLWGLGVRPQGYVVLEITAQFYSSPLWEPDSVDPTMYLPVSQEAN